MFILANERPQSPVELVVPAVGGVYEVLHVGSDQHLPQPREVTVVLILHLHHAPGILPSPHILIAHLEE